MSENPSKKLETYRDRSSSASEDLPAIETALQEEKREWNVSIGILAYNEADQIGKALQSLFEQSLFKRATSAESLEIVVVPNGCTDDTAAVAHSTLEKLLAQAPHPRICSRICEIEQPGKCNAWNHYVAQFSDPSADYLFLMDADIHFLQPDTLERMLATLAAAPEAWVAVDTPVKDAAIQEKKNPIEWFSSWLSKSSQNSGPPGLCGQLYCARADKLRRIRLPVAMQGEDGFLATMIRTACFTTPDAIARIVRAPEACHVFEAYTDFSRMVRHERWIVLCNTIDWYLCRYLAENCTPQLDAGALIDRRNQENPLWLHDIIRTGVGQEGWWVIPHWAVFRRLRSLQHKPLLKAILISPIAIAAFLADAIVCLFANQELKSGGGMDYWGKT